MTHVLMWLARGLQSSSDHPIYLRARQNINSQGYIGLPLPWGLPSTEGIGRRSFFFFSIALITNILK